jgi:cell division septation protein DedD
MPTGEDQTLLEVSTTEIIVISASGSHQTANLQQNGQVQSFTAVIDSTLPFLYLPQGTCDTLKGILGLSFDNKTGLYLLNDTQRSINQNNIQTIRISIADSQSGAAATSIDLPYIAFDLTIGWPVYNSPTRYFPIRPSLEGQSILGRVFLQEAYIFADYYHRNFSIANAALLQAGITNISSVYNSTIPSQPSSSHHLGAGAIAGIVIGAIAGIAIICLLAWLFYRQRKKTKKAEAKAIELQEQQEKTDRDRRHTIETVTSDFSGVTELDSAVGGRRPHANRHLSELSSESDGPRVVNPPGVIYELEGKTDTDAWQNNQSQFATDELATLRGQTPGSISPGTGRPTPRPSPFAPNRSMQPTPHRTMSKTSSVSPAGETPSPQPHDHDSYLEHPSPPALSPPGLSSSSSPGPSSSAPHNT